MTDTAALRAAAEAATPGPWEVGYWFGQCHEAHFPHPGGAECKYERTASAAPLGVRTMTPDVTIVSDDDIRPNDAAYIALASPDRILALCEENDELRRLLSEVTTLTRSDDDSAPLFDELPAELGDRVRAALEGKPTE